MISLVAPVATISSPTVSAFFDHPICRFGRARHLIAADLDSRVINANMHLRILVARHLPRPLAPLIRLFTRHLAVCIT